MHAALGAARAGAKYKFTFSCTYARTRACACPGRALINAFGRGRTQAMEHTDAYQAPPLPRCPAEPGLPLLTLLMFILLYSLLVAVVAVERGTAQPGSRIAQGTHSTVAGSASSTHCKRGSLTEAQAISSAASRPTAASAWGGKKAVRFEETPRVQIIQPSYGPGDFYDDPPLAPRWTRCEC